jgi:NDP-sugar pyrophosphorylase family protein
MPALPGGEFQRLRDYLGWLVDEGHKVYGIDLHQVLDVDRQHDLVQAERAVSSWSERGGNL